MLNKKIYAFSVLFVLFMGIPLTGFSAEHPGTALSGDEAEKVKQAATTYIDQQVKEKGGVEVADAVAGKNRQAKFDSFHAITKLDNGDYFFCADFTEGTDRLDLDFTLNGSDLTVKQVKIHKVNGVERE